MTKKKKMPDRRAAVAGEAFEFDGKQHVIHPRPTTASATDRGFWFCCSCGHGLQNNMQKDMHCAEPRIRKPLAKMTVVLGEPARHVLCWVDYSTGQNQEP